MGLLSSIYRTVIDALFPLSAAEQELFSYSPEEACEKLPPAPTYSEPIPGVYSVFAYKDERVAKLVWNIKYKRSKKAVEIGGYALWMKLVNLNLGNTREFEGRFGLSEGEGEPAAASADADGVSRGSLVLSMFYIIPIPITSRRRKERGYNQCELLVDEIARLIEGAPASNPFFIRIDTEKRFMIEKNLLIRTQHASRQTLKGRADRLQSAKGIFEVQANELDRKIPVVIVDDVITTGSTIKEAMKTVKTAGFENVYGLSLAH